MRLLLVEDDPMNIELFVDVMEGDGHTVVVERDGLGGRDRALETPFDLIILDLQLPRLRGDALCRELRDAGMTTPIVALSAEALPAQVASGRAAGFDEYLTKPVAPAELRAAIRRFQTDRRTAQ